MFNKILKIASLYTLILVSACSTYNRVPKAINKPKKLQLGETKQTAPIYNVERENVAEAYTPYSGTEPIKKLFDFSNSAYTEPKVEIKKTTIPHDRMTNNFKLLDKSTRKRGNGCLLCMKDKIVPVDKENTIVPIWMI